MDFLTQDTKAVVLVGGLGTRLRSVLPSTPKPLASVGDRPFLELLVRQLRYQGIRRLVLCTGYLADEIENGFSDGSTWGVSIEYSKEPHPMGTAGAVKFAAPLLQDSTDFVNAGIYVFNRRILEQIPEGPGSLETDIFPRLLDHGVYASEQHGVFIDIGTPQDYARAQELCERLYAAAYRKRPASPSD